MRYTNPRLKLTRTRPYSKTPHEHSVTRVKVNHIVISRHQLTQIMCKLIANITLITS